MKVVTVHRGARDGYQVARALGEADLLERLVTDLYWPADGGWTRRIESGLPRSVARVLRRRCAAGVPADAVTSCRLTGLSSLMAGKAPWLPFPWQRAAVRWCDSSLGRRAGRIATRKGAALLSYSYYAHAAFSHYTGCGPRILFQLHPHPASVQSVLRQERERHPDCAASLDREWELALPEADFRRLVEEATMAQYWIAASSYTKRTLTDAGIPEERITVIPYGIDLSRFSPGLKERRAGEPLRLLFVGTLGQRKGIKYLVQAMEMLPPGRVELTVCGRPVDDLAIFRRSRARIHLRPSVTEQGLREAYQMADVFVFPSLAEGFAHVLLEAMASGLAIISTDRTAAPDLIRHGREGFIVQAGSALDLAAHIEILLRSPASAGRMGEAARQRAEFFTWSRFRRAVAQFVNGVLDCEGAPRLKPCLPH